MVRRFSPLTIIRLKLSSKLLPVYCQIRQVNRMAEVQSVNYGAQYEYQL